MMDQQTFAFLDSLHVLLVVVASLLATTPEQGTRLAPAWRAPTCMQRLAAPRVRTYAAMHEHDRTNPFDQSSYVV